MNTSFCEDEEVEQEISYIIFGLGYTIAIFEKGEII